MSKKKTESVVRSLYQCSNAKVNGKEIYCAKGKAIGTGKGGKLNIEQLMSGKPLERRICQTCADYNEMGPPIPPEERGWMQMLKHKGG
ncbi:MAG: hypothetical protein PHI12_08320 [Dehalococcoidales bacterium]|nr:hypothetical protein [Dehalococcoidales bacterium]